MRGDSPFCHLVGPDWRATELRRHTFNLRAGLDFFSDADYEISLPEMCANGCIAAA